MNKNLQSKLRDYNWLKKPYVEYSIVDCVEFFDGNNVKGSFAANACTANYDIKEFQKAFAALLERDDVQNVWINLYSYDDDEEWPYSDTAYISTTLSDQFLYDYFGEAFPSEISINEKDEAFESINDGFTLYMLWWD